MHNPIGHTSVGRYKVLVGDDDPAMLRLLSRWLENAGYPTRTVTDGQEALEATELECPDFVITDWEMPRITGLELCRRLREMVLPHYVYILFLTVKATSEEMIAALDVGANNFLRKPVSQGELLARMRSGSQVLELERRLTLMARTDALTGLLTQRSFYEVLAREWHRSQRHHLPLSCVMVDLDFFKQVNDVHGHPTGDSLLKMAAELLLDNCRAGDSVCRYGGEEFAVLLPETGERDAAAWAERTRQRLAGLRIPTRPQELRVTGSFGVAECRDDMRNSEELVNLADEALLCAKRMGRDRVVSYASVVDATETGLQPSKRQDRIFQDIRARDVMSPLTACLHETNTIDETAQFLLQTGIPSSPVLGADNQLAGFVSEKEIMTALASPQCWHRAVSTVMRTNVIRYEEDTPIRTIYEFLCRVAIHRVVITREGLPTGTISRDSLLRWFRNWVISMGLVPPVPPCPLPCGCSTIGMASGPDRRTLDIVLPGPSVE